MVNFQFKSLCHDIYLLCIEIQSNIVNKLPYSKYPPPHCVSLYSRPTMDLTN